MKEFRVYLDLDSIEFDQIYQLPMPQSHHLAKVLRMRVGDEGEVFDGLGHCFVAKIVNIAKQVSIQIGYAVSCVSESPLGLTLMVAMGKGEKMDWIVQKATELGIHTIIPVLSKRCEVRLDEARLEKKRLRFQEISINACEQCGLNRLPEILPILPLSRRLQEAQIGLKLLLHPGEEQNTLQKQLVRCQEKAIVLLVGPEGGFTEDEVKLAKEAGFVLISLGPRILRMETAAIVSIAIAQSICGDL